MLHDIRYACRTLRKNRGFALIAILSIALGIAANSTAFSLAESLVLRPLAVPRPWQVVNVVFYRRGEQIAGVALPSPLSYPDFVDFRNKSKSFAGMTGLQGASFGFAADKQAQPKSKFGLFVTGNFFDVLGVPPRIGRSFRAEEDQVPGRDAVVVISHNLWVNEFGSKPDAIGKTVLLDGVSFTIIGIAPASFTGTDQFTRPELYVPMMMQPRLAGDAQHNPLEDRSIRGVTVKGRVKPGISVSKAAAEARVIASELEKAYPNTNRSFTGTVHSEFQLRIANDPYDAMLFGFILLLAVAVLLIACANVANLMLSRAWARSREIALRLAVGAPRGRLIRQLLTESLVIAVLGGAVGLALAGYAASALSPITIPSDIPIVLEVNLDPQVLLYTLIATFASAILFGLIPAFQATRMNLAPALRSTPGTSGKRGRLLGRNGLVVAQVAGSLVLLAVAAQAFRGTLIVLSSPAGFRQTNMLMASFDPSLVRYSPAQTQVFYDHLVDSARRMTGVKSAALTQVLPMYSLGFTPTHIVPGGFQLAPGSESVTVMGNTVSDSYFETLDIPILQGRGFFATDKAASPRVAVVNELLAHKYFPNQNPIGKRIRLNGTSGPQVEIVGVAKMSKYVFIVDVPFEVIYLPLKQNPQTHLALLLASAGPSAGLTAPLRDLVRSIDPGQPLIAVRTIEEYFEQRATKTIDSLVGVIGGLALLGLVLAIVGLYGLMSYSVARRTREIGIRMAIGADRVDVLAMVLKQGMLLAGIGIAIGLALSVLVGKAITAAMSMPPFNVTLLVLVPIGLLAVAALGAYLPARRASLVDPNLVLRND